MSSSLKPAATAGSVVAVVFLNLPAIRQIPGMSVLLEQESLAALLPWTPSEAARQGRWCHHSRHRRAADVFPSSLSVSLPLDVHFSPSSRRATAPTNHSFLQLLKFPWRSLALSLSTDGSHSASCSLYATWHFLFWHLLFFFFLNGCRYRSVFFFFFQLIWSEANLVMWNQSHVSKHTHTHLHLHTCTRKSGSSCLGSCGVSATWSFLCLYHQPPCCT